MFPYPNNNTGLIDVQLVMAKDVFPHIPNVSVKDPVGPYFSGTVQDFLKKHEDNKCLKKSEIIELANQLRNKVKVCASCCKPNAFTLSDCNSCGTSLIGVSVTYTSNVFSGFIYGIARGPFPLGISIRAQTEEFLVFDDLAACAPVHLNCIPTNMYCPDIRYLFENPEKGLILVKKMLNNIWRCVREQFIDNSTWRNKVLQSGGCVGPSIDGTSFSLGKMNIAEYTSTNTCSSEGNKRKKTEILNETEISDLFSHSIVGFNYPPSQYQLHMQYILPPCMPSHYKMYKKGVHFTYRRFFPLEYVYYCLALKKPIADVSNMTVEEIINHFSSLGINYDTIYSTCFQRYGDSHRRLANWNMNDFCMGFIETSENHHFIPLHSLNVTNEMNKHEITAINTTNKNIVDVIKADINMLTNYGRPFGPSGKPSCSFYKYSKSPPLPRF